jgi:hypothetical protein
MSQNTPQQDILRAIEHGFKLCYENGCTHDPRLRDAVWELFIEAGATVRKLPTPFPESVVLLGQPGTYWPETVREKAKGDYPRDRSRPDRPTAAEVSRMETVFSWAAVVQAKNRKRNIMILYQLACGVPVDRLRHQYGVHRQTIYDIREHALAHITVWVRGQLNRENQRSNLTPSSRQCSA